MNFSVMYYTCETYGSNNIADKYIKFIVSNKGFGL